jgi:hypothetical protein
MWSFRDFEDVDDNVEGMKMGLSMRNKDWRGRGGDAVGMWVMWGVHMSRLPI